MSLVGPGGVGKTRLAVRAAARVSRAFPDGSWLVDLANLRDGTLLAEHVAATLGLRDESGRWLVATLSDYLSGRRLLLILDNCEHLLDASAALVRALLQKGSELRIVATASKPVSRSSIWLAKFGVATGVLWVAAGLVPLAATVALVVALSGLLPVWPIVAMAIGIGLAIALYVALALAVSTTVPRQAAVAAIAIGAMFLPQLLGLLVPAPFMPTSILQ